MDKNGNLFRPDHIIKLISYILSQLIIGFICCYLGRLLMDAPTLHFNTNSDELRIFIVECILTGTFAIFALFINNEATRPTNMNWTNAFMMTLWLFVIILAGDDISGGCYNPALYNTMNLVSYLVEMIRLHSGMLTLFFQLNFWED
jgi:glycerol uptake facilitator-like aquaporin